MQSIFKRSINSHSPWLLDTPMQVLIKPCTCTDDGALETCVL
jgi:hypothetical protein